MGRVEGKVAFITGAARGQGRSHAVRLAEEGADIIAVDLCRQVESVPYPLAEPEDLAETVRQVEALGRRIVAAEADVRDFEGLKRAVDDGVAALGRLDIVSANAGVASFGRADELPEQTWQDMIDINLSGAWRTTKATIPHLKACGGGGSIILTSSTAGFLGLENMAHYVAAKHGIVGLVKSLARELAADMIRVNSVHPTTVNTPMVHNEVTYELFAPDLKAPDLQEIGERFQTLNLLPIHWLEAVDVSNAVLWLASDEARYVTGAALPVDAGTIIK